MMTFFCYKFFLKYYIKNNCTFSVLPDKMYHDEKNEVDKFGSTYISFNSIEVIFEK